MEISLVVPTYNDGPKALQSVVTLKAYLDHLGVSYEILLVDDGSLPKLRPDASQLPSGAQLVQILKNKGKGHAVKRGMMAAQGSCRMFLDADLPFHLDCIGRAWQNFQNYGCAMIVGDRSHPGSTQDGDRPWERQLMSHVLFRLNRVLLLISCRDTQCGFKAFSADFAKDVFPKIRSHGFTFDIELFLFAYRNGYDVYHVPVSALPQEGSKVRTVLDSLGSLSSLIEIYRNRNSYHLGKLAAPHMREGHDVDCETPQAG